MNMNKYKKAVTAWINEGYKFKFDKKLGPIVTKGKNKMPICDETYWVALQVMKEPKPIRKARA